MLKVPKLGAVRPRVQPLLRADLLESGDVILSGRKTANSIAIQRATSGHYSHAELVVTTVWRFDATSQGVGFRAADIIKCETQPDGTIYWLEDVGPRTHFDVFRHPGLAAAQSKDKTEFAARLRGITIELEGRQYSELRRLVDMPTALDQYPRVKKTLRKVLERVDAKNEKAKRINPGSFCSELVASIYEQLGVALFIRTVAPVAVAPNTLANSRMCKLRRLKGVTAHVDPGKPNVTDLLDLVRIQASSPMNERNRQVQLRTDAARAMKRAQLVGDALDRVIRILGGAGEGGPLV